ncbi:M56 family metallopeptidase [Winogradskyella thalassocola]|uniref:BlaR1 peptidase M56 n=1 Tax=Winogradskyella thalassocola TaxID=262004 RepID=A0A1G7Y8D8_9FLAO|nr:M56 family metallopeptidase [Winogradskyella thalassocola]SDG92200.1 BlaR1 peptidase M56 [Winogradskyella thalassocola]
METYLLKFSACLCVFWLVYVLFLEHQNMHRFKRFYLLSVLILALAIPTLTITEYVEPVTATFETAPVYFPMELVLDDTTIEEAPFFNLETTLWLIYGFGVLMFASRFIINLVKMQRRIVKNDNINKRSFIYVLLHENIIPHSFFRYIFFNKTRYESDNIPKEVLLHEETHARQLHSLDIIIIELLQIIFWFHPLIYILKHHVKLNHEFLADQAVLEQGTDTKVYQHILLQFSSNTQNHQLSSAINYSSIKKRFTVMKTQTSKTRIWLSTVLVLPIIAILFYSFAEKEYVEKDNIKTSELLQVQNESQSVEASEKLMQEYRDFITSYKETNTVHFNKYERAIIIYNELMSEKQRASVETFPEHQENSLLKNHNFLEDYIKLSKSKVEPNQPTSAQFESWKNTKEFAIWLDGKNVPNSELDNYSLKDIVHFSESKVYKNARTAKFPQPFQSSLYTKEGFRKTYEEADVTKYRKLTKTYSEAIGKYLKGPQTDNSELKILKAQADKLYNQFTKEELEKHNILMAPPVPAQYINSNSQEEPIMVILINRNGELLVKNNYASLGSIESKLKTLSKSFDDSNSVFVKFDESEASKKALKNIITLIRKYDFKIIQADASQIAPPPPPAKQKTSKGGPNAGDTQSVYNPSFLEYIVEMEKDGASFYLDDEKISAKEAKAIATNNNGKRTNMTTQKDSDGNYLVKLSSAQKKKIYARSIELKVLNENSYLIDGIKATKETFVDVFNQLHQDITSEERKNYMNIHVKSSKEISNKEVWFIFNSLQDYGFYRIVAPNQEINRAKGNTPFAIESHISIQDKPTDEEVSAYNAWAKQLKKETLAAQENERNGKTANYPIVKQKDLIKYVGIYKRMTSTQKENSVELPIADDELKTTGLKFPPPPPPTKSQDLKEKIVIGYSSPNKAKENNAETYPSPSKPEDLEPITVQGHPSKSAATLDYVIKMAKSNAKFFNEGKSISSDEAIDLLKKHPKLNINAQKTDTEQPLIYISKKPILIGVKGKVGEQMSKEQVSIIPFVNGKTYKTGKTSMTREEFKTLKLSTKNGKVTEFKFKIPGQPTQHIKSNVLDIDALKHLESAKKDDQLVLFALKDSSDSEIAPIVIIITD